MNFLLLMPSIYKIKWLDEMISLEGRAVWKRWGAGDVWVAVWEKMNRAFFLLPCNLSWGTESENAELSRVPHTKDDLQQVGVDTLNGLGTRANSCVPGRGEEDRQVSWSDRGHSMNALWWGCFSPGDRRGALLFLKPREDRLWREGC